MNHNFLWKKINIDFKSTVVFVNFKPPLGSVKECTLQDEEICFLLLHEGLISMTMKGIPGTCAWVHVQSLSWVWLFAILWTIACQALLSMGSSPQEYWSGLPYPPAGNLPDPGMELIMSSALLGDSLVIYILYWSWHLKPFLDRVKQTVTPFKAEIGLIKNISPFLIT